MRRMGEAAGLLVLLAGIFWTGRESTHGLSAFWEHWWCPVPLALILAGAAALAGARLAGRRTRPSS